MKLPLLHRMLVAVKCLCNSTSTLVDHLPSAVAPPWFAPALAAGLAAGLAPLLAPLTRVAHIVS
jgi:hypothetical protein